MDITDLEKMLPKEQTNLHGEVCLYDEQGALKGKITYQKSVKEGKAIFYSKNANTELECIFQKDLLNGPFTLYHPSGHKQSEGIFLEGLLQGSFKKYDEFGDLFLKQHMKKALLKDFQPLIISKA